MAKAATAIRKDQKGPEPRFLRQGPRIVHVHDHPDDRVSRMHGRWLSGVGVALVAGGWLGFQVLRAVDEGWLMAVSWAAIALGALLMLLGRRIVDAIEKRTWTRFCEANGWTYTHTDALRPKMWSGAHPFGKGHHRVAKNVVQGRLDGVAFEAWNYEFQTGSGKSRRTHNWRVVVVPMPVAAPSLTIERETAGKKVFDALGGEDIDFESDEFSRTFWVQCRDRRFAYAAIDPRMMEFLLAAGAERAWLWEGKALAATVEGRMDRRNVTGLLPDAVAFRERVPRHLTAPPRPAPVVAARSSGTRKKARKVS